MPLHRLFGRSISWGKNKSPRAMLSPASRFGLRSSDMGTATERTQFDAKPDELGFKNPSAIQQTGIVSFCKGLNVIQQAQAGAVMTVALCSGILQWLVYSFHECQALVLSPTRKGAQKIEKMLRALGCYLVVKVYAATGATSVCEDQQDFSNGFHVTVGTPGCILDMLLLLPSFLRMFGLGHADVMLDQVFDIFKRLPSRIQVRKVFQLLPSKIQVGLSLLQCRKIQYKPVRILLKQDEHIGKHIKQFYVDVEEEMKLESLVNLHDASATTESIIVFVTASTNLSLTDNIRTWLRTNGMRSCMNSNRDVLVFLSPPIINYDLPARARRSVCFGRRKNAVFMSFPPCIDSISCNILVYYC